MRRHTLLALSLAAGLALPVGFSTAALAVSDEERANLASAAALSPATLQAAIATVLPQLAADQPLNVALDDLAGVLLDLGVIDALKAEFAVSLVSAAQDLAAAGALPGFDGTTAGEAAAEAVLVRAQGSPSLVEAIVANAGAMAANDVPGGQKTAVFGAFVAASTSPLLDNMAQIGAVGAIAGTPFGNGGMGAGPQISAMNWANASTRRAGRGGSSERVGAGQSISPN
jgi:hypothetical protein